MVCKHCGAATPDNGIFCEKCGKRLAGQTARGGGKIPVKKTPVKKSILPVIFAALALPLAAGILSIALIVVLDIDLFNQPSANLAGIETPAPRTTASAPETAPEASASPGASEAPEATAATETPAESATPAEQASPSPKATLRASEDMSFSNFETYLLSLEDLKQLEAAERQIGNEKVTALELASNEIKAKYGYQFTDGDWKSYFSTKSWYTPSDSYDELQLSPMARANCLLMEMWLQREDKESSQWIKPVKIGSGDTIDLDRDGKMETVTFTKNQVFIDSIPVSASSGVEFRTFDKDKSTPFDYIYIGDVDMESSNGLELFIPASNTNEDLYFTNEVYRYEKGSSLYLGFVNRAEGTSLYINGLGKAKGKALYGTAPLRVIHDEVFAFGGDGFARETEDPANGQIYVIPRQSLHCFQTFDADITKSASDGDSSEEEALDAGEYFKLYEQYSNVYRYVSTDATGKTADTERNLVIYGEGNVYYVLQAGWLYYPGSDPVYIGRENIPIGKAFSNLWN